MQKLDENLQYLLLFSEGQETVRVGREHPVDVGQDGTGHETQSRIGISGKAQECILNACYVQKGSTHISILM